MIMVIVLEASMITITSLEASNDNVLALEASTITITPLEASDDNYYHARGE